jgi:hypothetical protein
MAHTPARPTFIGLSAMRNSKFKVLRSELSSRDHDARGTSVREGRVYPWTKPAGGWGAPAPPTAAKLVELLVLFFQF